METLENKFEFLSISQKTSKVQIFLLSKFYNPSTCIYGEISHSKSNNLCLNISGFVAVLSFGDLQGVVRSSDLF